MQYYLRMEAVNLSSFVMDTQDLSTVRGGGLLLLHSVQLVQTEFRKQHPKLPKLVPITTGASSGLFYFEAQDGEEESLRKAVTGFLRTDPELCHATFVVDVQRAESDFPTDREMVIARNRWRQFQQPTVVMPEPNDDSDVITCEIDRIRPATVSIRRKGGIVKASASVAARRRYGIDNKQHFYFEELRRHLDPVSTQFPEELKTLEFVYELDALTSDKSKGNLHHKMAVLYLDGNSFGKIQTRALNQALEKGEDPIDAQQQFDLELKQRRAEVLNELLKHMIDDPASRHGQALRLETLLWGGDELMWVVPAWKGWDVLKLFYQVSRAWKFGGQELTHAGGMVFCHHNAPIHRVRRLAEALAEAAKREAKAGGRLQNLFQYLVLESFDHIGQDLDSFRKRQYPAGAGGIASWKLSLKGEDMATVADKIMGFKDEFPRNKLFAGIHAARLDASKHTDEYTQYFDARLKGIVSSEAYERMSEAFKPFLGSPPGLWLHLADLWDYVQQ